MSSSNSGAAPRWVTYVGVVALVVIAGLLGWAFVIRPYLAPGRATRQSEGAGVVGRWVAGSSWVEFQGDGHFGASVDDGAFSGTYRTDSATGRLTLDFSYQGRSASFYFNRTGADTIVFLDPQSMQPETEFHREGPSSVSSSPGWSVLGRWARDPSGDEVLVFSAGGKVEMTNGAQAIQATWSIDSETGNVIVMESDGGKMTLQPKDADTLLNVGDGTSVNTFRRQK